MKKPTILILHGWGASSKSFQELKTLLEKQGFIVEVPDLPGFGETPLLKTSMTFDDYIDFAKDVIGDKKAIAIGHSFGGRILIAFTAKYPLSIEKLILVDASGITHPRSWKKNAGFVLAKFGKTIFTIPPLSFMYPLSRKMLYFFLDEWDYYKSKGALLETFKNVYRKDVQEYLPRIKVPTLIVWGAKDVTTPLSDAYVFQKNIKGSKLIVVPGASHELPYKMPHIFIEKILPFLT